MRVETTEPIPIKMWLKDIEGNALSQAKNLANLPFAFKHIAIMPDSHCGYGMPIGGVLATKGVVIPNAVGVDIGCGVCAVKTSLTEIDTETLKKILGKIREEVPVGFNKHKEIVPSELMPNGLGGSRNHRFCLRSAEYPVVSREFSKARKSLGTLGGGNHFVEIQKGDDGHIWIMIHSGSRNLGLQVATHYNKLAIELNKKWRTSVPEKHELAFLPLDSEEGKHYLKEMNYCVDFALANRNLMMERVIQCFMASLVKDGMATIMDTEPMINIAHNYATLENHFGQNVMIHRKGATSAREGEIGIIPGSQGTKSYIVEGLGNPMSFNSCSHGAGRTMGRKEAIRNLDFEKEKKALDDLGVIHSVRGKNDLDEAPSCYKDIAEVMENQKDLVKIKVELIPLAVIKG